MCLFGWATPCSCVSATVFVQTTGLQDEGLKVRTRPPICGLQSVKSQRVWLSAQGEDWTTFHETQKDLCKTTTMLCLSFLDYSTEMYCSRFWDSLQSNFVHDCHWFFTESPSTSMCLIRCLPWVVCHGVWAPGDLISITAHLCTSTRRFLWLLLFHIHNLSGHHIHSPWASLSWGNTSDLSSQKLCRSNTNDGIKDDYRLVFILTILSLLIFACRHFYQI